jgi:hypothetical protein
MQICLDRGRIAEEFVRLAGQVPRGPWPVPEFRSSHWSADGLVLTEEHVWSHQGWDRVVENCARKAGKTTRLKSEMQAWIDRYMQATGRQPDVVSASAAGGNSTSWDPMADLETWLDLTRDALFLGLTDGQEVDHKRYWLNSWVMGRTAQQATLPEPKIWMANTD